MKITYDRKVDALNVALRAGVVAKTLEIAPDIMLDLDKSGRPLYLEIIGASEKIGKKNFGTVTIGRRTVTLPVSA